MKKVDFIGVGASRSGSSWLSSCLSEHPEIGFSTEKEVHFFDDDYSFNKGVEYYHNFFKRHSPEKKWGEFTPGYFTNHSTAKRIFSYNPKAKILVVLRNPIFRAYSEYMYNFAREFETEPTFEKALKGQLKERYMSRGKYYSHLLPFYEIFPQDHILVIDYEDIKTDPEKVILQTFNFLEVDTKFKPSQLRTVVNSSNDGKRINYIPFLNTIISKLLSRHSIASSKTGRLVKKTGFPKMLRAIYKMNTNNLVNVASKNTLSSTDKVYFELKEFYEKDTAKLEILIKRNFNWF